MLKVGSIVFAMTVSAACLSQEAVPPAIDPSPVPHASQPVFASTCCRIADGTPVVLEILDPLNSSMLKRGDKFKLRLAEPLVIDGRIALAPGVEGVGEVIHAEKSRGGGKAGELLIAARYLDHQGLQVRLRGLKVGGSGKDNTKAALATAIVLGPFAHFVRGREIEIPAGTLAQAKIALDIALPPIEQMQGGPETTAESEHTSDPANPATANPPTPQTSGSASSAATSEPATPQQPTIETAQETKE